MWHGVLVCVRVCVCVCVIGIILGSLVSLLNLNDLYIAAFKFDVVSAGFVRELPVEFLHDADLCW